MTEHWQEAVSQPIISQVGSCCPLAPALELPSILEPPQQYGLWQVPFPMCADDWEAIFRRFGLWQSSNGLMQAGKHHHSLQRSEHHVTTTHPILVGDWLDNQPVLFASNRYHDRQRMWSCYVVHGTPPMPKKIAPAEYAFYQSIVENHTTLATNMVDLIKSVVEEILPLCTAGGYPVVSSPAKALLESKLLEAEQEMKQAIEAQKEAQWH